MTKTVKRSQRKLTPEQQKQFGDMAVVFSKQIQQTFSSVQKSLEIFAEQNKAINISLTQVAQSVKIPTIAFDIPAVDTTAITRGLEVCTNMANSYTKQTTYNKSTTTI